MAPAGRWPGAIADGRRLACVVKVAVMLAGSAVALFGALARGGEGGTPPAPIEAESVVTFV